jgi:hypothetical protein
LIFPTGKLTDFIWDTSSHLAIFTRALIIAGITPRPSLVTRIGKSSDTENKRYDLYQSYPFYFSLITLANYFPANANAASISFWKTSKGLAPSISFVIVLPLASV